MTVQQRAFVIDLSGGLDGPYALPAGFTSTRVTLEYFSDAELQTPVTPTGGYLLCETTDAAGDTNWRKMHDGRMVCAEIADYPYPYVDYPALAIRFTPESVTGAAYARATVWSDTFMAADPIDPLVYLGLRALVIQPYTEANIKNGLQFGIRFSWPKADPIAAGTTRYVRARTGDKVVIFKGREVHYVAEQVALQIYANPTNVSGGESRTPSNFNLNPAVAKTPTMEWWKGTAGSPITYDTIGDPLDEEPEHFFGGSAAGQRSASTLAMGRERVLVPNTEFILAFTTPSGVGDSFLQYSGDWYEGDPDLPRP